MGQQKHNLAVNFWFDHQAEEAARYYTSIFRDSKIGRIVHYGNEGQDIHKQKPGSVMLVEFWLNGQQFTALNGGPLFKFNESISIVVNCETQQEIDEYWNKLTEGGDPASQQCGWLKDKYGVSWQIVPTIMKDLMKEDVSPRTEAVMRVMMQMKKLDIAQLQNAYDQAGAEKQKKKSPSLA